MRPRFSSSRRASRPSCPPRTPHELGIRPGDEVEVAMNGTSVRAIARLRQAVQPGTVFLLEGS